MQSPLILLVEDNPDDELLLRRALRQSPQQPTVVVAHDGVEALDYLFRPSVEATHTPAPLPRLILLDLELPRLNGLDVLRRVRAETRTQWLPVVILTSSAEARDLTASYHAGCNSYVCKPVDFSRYLAIAQHLTEYWLGLNISPPHVS